MKILVSLPKEAKILKSVVSIDQLIAGELPSSGTNGSIIRLANLLCEAGFEVSLSGSFDSDCSNFAYLKHEQVRGEEFDYLIVHQSHWDGRSLTFGNQFLGKTFLSFHVCGCFATVHNFLQAGGYRVVCPSVETANTFRAVPGWEKKVVVAYNSYNYPIFTPTLETPERKLLFIGAIRPHKGFIELMKIWSYLAKQEVDFKLTIVGSIQLHDGDVKMGAVGVANPKFEEEYIEPWLKSLPRDYQPQFLGALPPRQLYQEINRSWAVIVNPSWYYAETFCISAVEAQACNRTVFSVAEGGLKETVYKGKLQTLATEKNPEALGKLILDGLSAMEAVAENGRLAGDFVRNKFSPDVIRDAWINLLSGHKSEPSLPKIPRTPRELFHDVMRYSQTSPMYYSFRSPHDRKILSLMPKS
ncbi:hypothetical protein myaer87_10020 [Microcystis aeruginosa NIES-87]|jgi:glycosyltransferase involved in cell wall biosynthesis|uniref:glycosyltransferase family 4 protein n=1 Tax=Microcystis sp. M169S2 TaxID=2771157 RepID=UPI000CC69D77|nr:glycosyltransferase family 4 protein [Microcystis sp. M169S2]MCA2717799.1 glycosyltransferase family 4 protein [Microcystis sp. M169S2]GBE73775.1 hypothetical protein myaer87_10020 [Microcystis aeruginosa NIES-87]